MAACIFCRIIKGMCCRLISLVSVVVLTSAGEIPSLKLFESDKTFAFLDINPLSQGHAVSELLSLNFVRGGESNDVSM